MKLQSYFKRFSFESTSQLDRICISILKQSFRRGALTSGSAKTNETICDGSIYDVIDDAIINSADRD